MRLFSIVCLFLCASFGFAKNGLVYNTEDLIALEQSKSYQEFLEHAHDIRPSKRDKSWRKMVEHMATGFIDRAIERKDYKEKTFHFIQQITKWGELSEDAYFHSKREIYSLKYLENCTKNQLIETCIKRGKEIWDIGQKNRDTGVLIAGTLISKTPEVDVFYFANKAIKSDFGEFYCRKKFIQKAIYEKLYSLTLKIDEPKLVSKVVDENLGEGCFETFAKTLKSEIENDDRTVRDFSYKILAAKKAIEPELENYYLVRFLLDGPVKGRIFNLAWARMKELSQDFSRREQLLRKLKSIDPLPDRVFASSDELKKTTIANHFYQNFPEYMNQYTKDCLNYLEGKGFYPNGNPTVRCNDFMETVSKTKWMNDDISIKYSGLKKFKY